MNWGYAVCDVALRGHLDAALQTKLEVKIEPPKKFSLRSGLLEFGSCCRWRSAGFACTRDPSAYHAPSDGNHERDGSQGTPGRN
jgi:hypothetical protein